MFRGETFEVNGNTPGNLPPLARRHNCHKVRLHSYSDGSRSGAQLAVACPTPVRAAEDWLEPRDAEQQGEKENQTWITAPFLRSARTSRAARRLCAFWATLESILQLSFSFSFFFPPRLSLSNTNTNFT